MKIENEMKITINFNFFKPFTLSPAIIMAAGQSNLGTNFLNHIFFFFFYYW